MLMSDGELANGHIHTVRRADPPYLFHYGEGYQAHRLPAGTRVVYPKPSLPGMADG